jgi:hypothetical protein
MRNYQILDSAIVEAENVLRLSNAEDNPEKPMLSMSREGAFLTLSVSFGPLELALRLRHDDVKRRLEHLHPVPGLATTLQIGTGNAYIAIGLTTDNRLVMRPTLVADASGRLIFNLVTTSTVYGQVREWLDAGA